MYYVSVRTAELGGSACTASSDTFGAHLCFGRCSTPRCSLYFPSSCNILVCGHFEKQLFFQVYLVHNSNSPLSANSCIAVQTRQDVLDSAYKINTLILCDNEPGSDFNVTLLITPQLVAGLAFFREDRYFFPFQGS